MIATTQDATEPAPSQPPALDVTGHALFLDLDGTLVEIAARPDDVVLDDRLRAHLARLVEFMDGAVAIVTGRRVVDAARVIDGAIGPISGLHGLERQTANGEVERHDDDPQVIAAVREELRELERSGVLGAVIEDKELSFALHYRHAPELERSVRELGAALSERHGLRLLEGKMVVELMRTARTKGDAIADFMRDAPFAGRAPVALGDDVTDEDAFKTAQALGGFAILVGPPRPTAAAYRLADVTAVRAWLETSVA